MLTNFRNQSLCIYCFLVPNPVLVASPWYVAFPSIPFSLCAGVCLYVFLYTAVSCVKLSYLLIQHYQLLIVLNNYRVHDCNSQSTQKSTDNIRHFVSQLKITLSLAFYRLPSILYIHPNILYTINCIIWNIYVLQLSWELNQYFYYINQCGTKVWIPLQL